MTFFEVLQNDVKKILAQNFSVRNQVTAVKKISAPVNMQCGMWVNVFNLVI